MSWKEKFRMIASIYLVLKNEKDEVLLLLRKDTGYKDGEYGLPAGHVDGNEELPIAMVREAKEEAGIDINPEDLEMIHVMHRHNGDHERLDFFFTCNKWEGEVTNTEPHKCAELAWYAMDNLPENVIDYYKQMFDHVAERKFYSSFDWE
ncbi:MAG: NUDIX domain-containing protein [bacterium]|nr:NUDIX domain-containing protein [bacterium]